MDSSCWQLLFIYTMVLYQSDVHFFFAFLTMVELHLKRDIENKCVENENLKPFI